MAAQLVGSAATLLLHALSVDVAVHVAPVGDHPVAPAIRPDQHPEKGQDPWGPRIRIGAAQRVPGMATT
jgi:hypothetical protein